LTYIVKYDIIILSKQREDLIMERLVWASASENFRGFRISSVSPFFIKDKDMIFLNNEDKKGIEIVEIHNQYSS
jgi:hypothetical protein